MRSLLRALAVVIVAAAAITPLEAGSAGATGCDTNPADAVAVRWNTGPALAPNGTLASGNTPQDAVTAYNSSGLCVQGAQVSMQLRAVPGGGSVTTSTTGCPYGTVGPNVSVCTTDASGTIPIWYHAATPLPNDGTDYLDAWTSSSSATQTVNYTYGSMSASGVQLSGVEGSTFSGTVATAKLYNFAVMPALQASIAWGDGTSSAGTVAGPSPGSSLSANGTSASVTISGRHPYAEESANAMPIRVTLTAPTTATAISTGSITITDAPLTATAAAPVTVKRRASATVTVATFSDGDPGAAVDDYTASIAWGDGSTTTGSITTTSGRFTVTGSHTYSTNGTYAATGTITDAGGAVASASTAVKVTSNGH